MTKRKLYILIKIWSIDVPATPPTPGKPLLLAIRSLIESLSTAIPNDHMCCLKEAKALTKVDDVETVYWLCLVVVSGSHWIEITDVEYSNWVENADMAL